MPKWDSYLEIVKQGTHGAEDLKLWMIQLLPRPFPLTPFILVETWIILCHGLSSTYTSLHFSACLNYSRMTDAKKLPISALYKYLEIPPKKVFPATFSFFKTKSISLSFPCHLLENTNFKWEKHFNKKIHASPLLWNHWGPSWKEWNGQGWCHRLQ